MYFEYKLNEDQKELNQQDKIIRPITDGSLIETSRPLASKKSMKTSNLVADILADHTLLCNFDTMNPFGIFPTESW